MNIYLIGYRAVGKTTIGKKLAEKLNYEFFDSDVEIEKSLGMKIDEIVKNKSWEYFRKKEKEFIKKTIKLKKSIISTGGGVILDNENINIIKNGIVIFLDASPKIIYNRMKNDLENKRPELTSLKLEEEIKITKEKRMPLYKKAQDIYINTDNKDVTEITNFLYDKISNNLN